VTAFQSTAAAMAIATWIGVSRFHFISFHSARMSCFVHSLLLLLAQRYGMIARNCLFVSGQIERSGAEAVSSYSCRFISNIN
jgi:hypothetical protein